VAGVPPYYALAPGVPHNEFLHVLVLLGLGGFAPYAAVLALGWRTGVRCHRGVALPGPGREVALTCLAVLAVYVVNGLFVDLMANTYASSQLYVLLGATDGLRLRESPA
jgi:O-antigen ligase